MFSTDHPVFQAMSNHALDCINRMPVSQNLTEFIDNYIRTVGEGNRPGFLTRFDLYRLFKAGPETVSKTLQKRGVPSAVIANGEEELGLLFAHDIDTLKVGADEINKLARETGRHKLTNTTN